jgi:hypothetical protein
MNFCLALAVCALGSSCAQRNVDSSRPATEGGHKGLQERLSDGGGVKQDASGQWVPKSDRRSSYDSQRDSAYFKGKVEKEQYKTGEYAKKSWWGNKGFETSGYQGDTDGSRFRTKAIQDGMTARDGGKEAREGGSYKTNTLEQETARESGVSPVDRPVDAAVESQRGLYKAPSIIDWREQRSMSMEQSRGLLGR